jgi:tRNA threonylcarbamoyladenosine biosynthesis protein TsaB
VAVIRGDAVAAEVIGDPSRTHGERLPLDMMRALELAAATLQEVDLLAVTSGPGSFTGLRVGLAAIQGLAMALERRVVPISTFDALAASGADGRSRIATWIDAQRGEVFAALYDPSASTQVRQPTSLPPADTLREWSAVLDSRPLVFIGDGAIRYADVVRDHVGVSVPIIGPPALASVVGRLAAREPNRAVLPHAIVPVYVRKSDAELARARQRAAAAANGPARAE